MHGASTSIESTMSLRTSATLLPPNSPAQRTDFALRELWRVGGIDVRPENEFAGPYFVAAFGPHGEATILDQSQSRISVFDGTSGEFVRSFGRRGRGPGELYEPEAMVWDTQGRLWVADRFNRRYTVFDSSGSLEKEVERFVRPTHRRIFPIIITADAEIVDHAVGGGVLRILTVDSLGNVRDSLQIDLPQFRDPLRGGVILPGSALQEVVGLFPHLRWGLAPNGASIWLSRSDSLALLQIDLSGDTLSRVRFSGRVASFTNEQRVAIGRANRELGRDAEFVPILVQAVHVLNDGRVLVQIGNTMETPGREFELFDRSGSWLGTVQSPFAVQPESVLASRGDTLLVSAVGELDVPLLIKAVLEQVGGGERTAEGAGTDCPEQLDKPSTCNGLHITDWVHVTRPAAATGAGTRTGRLGKAPDTPPPSCRSAPGAS